MLEVLGHISAHAKYFDDLYRSNGELDIVLPCYTQKEVKVMNVSYLL